LTGVEVSGLSAVPLFAFIIWQILSSGAPAVAEMGAALATGIGKQKVIERP
jgi:hypothetical protein